MPRRFSTAVALVLLAASVQLSSSVPLYECQTAVLDLLLVSSSYRRPIAPLGETGTLAVTADVQLDEVSVFDQATPALQVSGTVLLGWKDPRLAWDPSQVVGGCTEIQVAPSEIWVPAFDVVAAMKGAEVCSLPPTDDAATIMADGTVSLALPIIEARAPCQSIDGGFEKLCTVPFRRGAPMKGIEYVAAVQVENEAALSVPGYRLDTDISMGTTSSDEMYLQLRLKTLETACSICGGITGTTLRNETVPASRNVENAVWNILFPDQFGSNCQQLNDFVSAQPDSFQYCALAHLYFMRPCCEGLPSESECEDSVRNHQLEKDYSAVVAPDNPEGKDLLDVTIYLDVLHLLDIDIRSNTMEMLVSLELLWTDTRLAWDPLIGGCYGVSYRASLDPEVTEIWVPEADLLNQVEGAQTLPDSFASVYFDGLVWWRRTGVVKAACDLSNIDEFPFDHPICSMDFGATRSPRFHRVNYLYTQLDDPVEYSKRILDRSAEFQEYQLDTQFTTVSLEAEDMSGYVNEFVRFQFHFTRATEYYIYMFVVLIIMFTYMSFGMVLLDHKVGERLGFGTSMLFVVVAQDITMSEYTPVSQILLWIYKFSFGSKMFMIFGIVESLAVLYMYFHHDLDEECEGAVTSFEEVEQFVGSCARVAKLIEDGAEHENGVEEEASGPASVDGEVEQEGDPPKNKWCWSSIKTKILKYRPNPDDPEIRQRAKRLRVIDICCFVVLVFVYTVFVLVMILVAKPWDTR